MPDATPADKPRVVCPVRSKREFHRDARCDTNDERRGEQLHPETRCVGVLRQTRTVRPRLGNRRDEADAYRKRDEHEVERNNERELQSGEKCHVTEQFHHTPPLFPLKAYFTMQAVQ